MGFIIHELIHIVAGLLIGYFVWKRWQRLFVSFFSALLGSVLVDIDHFIDYFLAFGLNFNLNYFLKGYAFLKSDKVYVPFHAWEWVILCLIIYKIIEKKSKKTLMLKYALSLLLAFSLGLSSHLIIDTLANQVILPGYSLIYRGLNNFDVYQIVKKDHYQKHLIEKNRIFKK